MKALILFLCLGATNFALAEGSAPSVDAIPYCHVIWYGSGGGGSFLVYMGKEQIKKFPAYRLSYMGQQAPAQQYLDQLSREKKCFPLSMLEYAPNDSFLEAIVSKY